MSSSGRRFLILLGFVFILAGGMLLDHLLGREDRMEAARRQAALIEVRDQVLRYELEYGSPPKSLGVLMPGYL